MTAFKFGVTPEHKPGGYPRMSCGPQVNKFVHVLVAQAKIGRELRPDEHVHHKDGDTKNPHPDNLLVVKDEIHNAVSNRQYWYLKQLFKREDAAWKAFFDVTGETYDEYETRQIVETYDQLMKVGPSPDDEKAPIN